MTKEFYRVPTFARAILCSTVRQLIVSRQSKQTKTSKTTFQFLRIDPNSVVESIIER